MNICVVITMINYFIVCHSMVGTTKPMDNYTLFEFLEVRSWPERTSSLGQRSAVSEQRTLSTVFCMNQRGAGQNRPPPPRTDSAKIKHPDDI